MKKGLIENTIVKNDVVKTFTTFGVLSLLVIGVSIFLISQEDWIGPVYLLLGFLSMSSLKYFKIKSEQVKPDIIFGMIDNGVLIFTAVLGGVYAGVAGAVLGGAAGNTITDGLGGIFEGREAQKLRKMKVSEKRSELSTMLGKMIGCLLGAGIGLSIVSIIRFIF